MTIRKFIWASVGALMVFLALPTAASAAPAAVTPQQCGKDTYFIFEYNDSGTVGIDQGCADSNNVTAADVPGLIARELHVSCSDKFIGGVGQKSDLGDPNRRVVAWQIIKDGGKKTCGNGTPIPQGGSMGLAGATGLIVALGAVGIGVAKFRRRDTDSLVANA